MDFLAARQVIQNYGNVVVLAQLVQSLGGGEGSSSRTIPPALLKSGTPVCGVVVSSRGYISLPYRPIRVWFPRQVIIPVPNFVWR